MMWLKKSLVIFLGFLKMIKLLLILFIIKLYARNNIFKENLFIYLLINLFNVDTNSRFKGTNYSEMLS